MQKYIKELFNIQGLVVDKIELQETSSTIVIHCHNPQRTLPCPSCGTPASKIHQYHQRLVKHSRLDDKQIILNLRVRRLQCRQCRTIFTEPIDGIDRKRASVNFRTEAISWLQKNSYKFISQRFGVSGPTLTRYVKAVSDCWLIDWEHADVTVLGIDEHSFRGKKLVITITDISNRKLLAILTDDRKETLITFLRSIPKKALLRIAEVSMDLKWSYHEAVREVMPEADIVADRFHVEELVKRTVDQIRAVVQSKDTMRRGHLKHILTTNYYALNDRERTKLAAVWQRYEHYPVLKESWIIKEKIIAFYQCHDPRKAAAHYNYVAMLLATAHDSAYITALRHTWKRWRKPILNYFNHRTTNGFTEGVHTKIKMMKRVSFGFRNLTNYIAKMMLAFVPFVTVANYLIHHTNC